MSPYIELRCHSAYSLLEGALRVKALAGLAKEAGMPAIGVTDTNNLFGSLEISETLAGKGVQPLIGCTLSLKTGEPDSRQVAKGALSHPRLALFAMNEEGLENLTALVSKARADNDPAEPHALIEDLRAFAPGVLCLTGGLDGPVNRYVVDGALDEARALLSDLAEIFEGRLYVELQRHGLDAEKIAEPHLLDWAYELTLPIVATNEPYFPTTDLHEAHDCLLCVAQNAVVIEDTRRKLTPEHYFKSAEEMAVLFADLPEALGSTAEIAQRIHVRPKTRKSILPAFDASEGDSEAEVLRIRAHEGLTKRFELHEPVAEDQVYRDRLDYELGVIETMGFPGYFLIVADFIAWSKEHGIPVGPGRGSGAGSLVAWSLTITDLDPLRFGLLFERFLNPERVSMPDFDVDFCPERRDEVFDYVREKYGADKVAQIITFGKLQARAVLRDVGRVLQMPYPQVDRLCKLVPSPPGKTVTLAEAIAGEPRLRQEAADDETVDKLLSIGQALEGLYRHSSTHAAGVVIGDRPLTELIPITRDPDADMLVTQLDMKWVEKAGLVKFDFLALKTLTVLQRTVEFLVERGTDLPLEKVPLDDETTFDLLGRADTMGVFQVEGAGMRDVLRKMKPSRIDDLIALVALYRPGPMDDIPRYIACKHGREEITYAHPMLEPILAETYGVIVYQEQVMEIAKRLSGFSLGEADLLRRAMGKKIKEEMDKQKERFITGAKDNNIEAATAETIFDAIAKFAGYGFNKCHSAPYALVSYFTAFFKANYPLEFMAATMSLDINNTDKLAQFRQDAVSIGCKVVAPTVNKSVADFSVQGDEIVYGLAAIKSVGRQAMDEIVAERAENGPFKDVFDFVGRTAGPSLNRRAFETLARAGVFDEMYENRAELVANADVLLAYGARTVSERESKQVALFASAEEGVDRPRLRPTAAWPQLEKLQAEAEAVGFFLSGHPLDDYATVLRRARVTNYQALLSDTQHLNRRVKLAGMVIKTQERRSQRTDKPFAFVEFTDPSGRFETVIFSDLLSTSRELLEAGKSLVLTADVEWEGDEMRLRVQGLEPLDKVASQSVKSLRIFLDTPEPLPSIKEHLDPSGRSAVSFIVFAQDQMREVEVELKDRYVVNPRVRSLLKAVPGVVEVEEI